MVFGKFWLIAGVLLGLMVPRASAIIVSGTSPDTSQWSASSLSGVVFFGGNQESCSGALFEASLDYVLTAGHCVNNLQAAITAGTSYVQLQTGVVDLITGFTLDPGFAYLSSGEPVDDIAVLQLATPAAAGTQYYPIYTGSSPVGDEFTLAGEGDAGTGTGGDLCGSNTADCYYAKTAREGQNVYDFTSATSGGDFPSNGTDLFYDFQTPTDQDNAFKSAGLPYNNFVTNEASIGPGDSGGPSLINVNGVLEIAGVHSFAGCFENSSGCLFSASTTFDYGYGSFAADTNVSLFTNFIDSAIGVTATPEPGTFGIFGISLAALGIWNRRRQKNRAEL